MADTIDPEVREAIRRIIDRFLRLGEATPSHEVRVKLGAKRHELDALAQKGLIRSFQDKYLPGIPAVELEDAEIRNLVRGSTALVLRGLRQLYEVSGPKQYSADEIREAAQRLDATATPEMVTIGMLFATDLRKYCTSYGFSPSGAVTSLTPIEEIIDFQSIDPAWNEVANAGMKARTDETAHPNQQTAPDETILQGAAVARPYGRWEAIKELGRGGQGIVYLVRDTSQLDVYELAEGMAADIRGINDAQRETPSNASALIAEELADRILKYAERDSPRYLGALKVLHQPDKPDDLNKRMERMKTEVQSLRDISHPNVIRILDANLDRRWFVAEYFPDGSLAEAKHRGKYRGRLMEALTAFRPLVEAVAELHGRKLVHRDIKPENIFVSPERGLVLGDFGLVFFADEGHTRVSDTLENVGSRDWMPGWALTVRLEDVKPSFDVFCLGKVLWSMLAGGARAPLWYIHKPDFELEKMFSDDPDMRWAGTILDTCVVEEEMSCLPNAGALLEEIVKLVPRLHHGCAPLSPSAGIRCRFCGVGRYLRARTYEAGSNMFGHFGTTTAEEADRSDHGRVALLRCSHCGHLEWFQLYGIENPRWWDR